MEKPSLIKFSNIIVYFAVFMFVICIIVLFGIFKRLAPFVNVMRGNDHYSRGEYGQAIINYFKANEHAEYNPYLQYNLGNVYAALGESSAAIDTLNKALSGENRELIFKTNFNLANLYYESNQYEAAVKHYIEALKANPNAIEAKIDLEIALKKLKSKPDINKNNKQTINPTGLNEQSQQLLELIQKKEEEVWQTQQQKIRSSEAQNDW